MINHNDGDRIPNAPCPAAHRTQALDRQLSRYALLLLGAFAAPAGFAETLVAAANLNDFSLEQLSAIIVTSVTRQDEKLADAAAAIFVISAEDLRRSGAATLPEALRLAPNLQIARVDARNYAVTARGFNSPFENKLLVLIDGRTVYTPLFSGVFWDAQDVVLEDIERIEVISGAGATLWGANAVNGVINIITRSAKDTQGALLAAGANDSARNGALRYGGTLGNGGHYRVYGKYADNDDTRNAAGTDLDEGWRRQQIGFRADWGTREQGVTVQGDVYGGRLHQFGTEDIKIGGANILGRMSRRLAEDSDLKLQATFDHTERDQPNAFVERLNTFDLDFQHALKIAKTHNVVWGGGYRLALDRVENATAFAFLPGSKNLHWTNAFIQDEIGLGNNLRLTLGTKFEENSYTGLEWLPSARLAWKLDDKHLLWSSASRAIRAPSRIDRDFYAPTNPAVVGGVPQFIINGGPDFASEVAKVFEIGYRGQLASTLSLSSTLFYSDYDKLRTLEPNTSGPGAVFANLAAGTSRGIEMSGTWQAATSWRLTAGMVAQRLDLHLKPGSHDMSQAMALANNDPSAYSMLRSSHDISDSTELDWTLRHVGALPNPVVPAYTTLDMRLGWKLKHGLELSLNGQNLLAARHAEFGAAPGRPEFERAVYVKLLWKQ